MKTKKVAFLGICIAISMVLSYFESLLPSFAALPGIKLGLPNIVSVFMLCKLGAKEAAAVSLIRVLLSSLLFSPWSIFYSLAGATLSLIGMILLKRIGHCSAVTVSVAGGILHNVAQIAVACFITSTPQIIYYLPVLLISGTAAGIAVGAVAALMLKRLDGIRL